MKKRSYTKLLSLVLVSSMFVFAFSLKAESGTKAKVPTQSNKTAKTQISKSVPDYWARLNNRFAWNTAGRMVPASGNNDGC